MPDVSLFSTHAPLLLLSLLPSTRLHCVLSDTKRIKQVQWCATEKVHGSNFCWIISEEGVRGGNRSKLLEPNEPFFGWQTVQSKVQNSLMRLFEILNSQERSHHLFPSPSPVARAFVFGELCGGTYPNMPSPTGVQAVQTGIYYSPNVEFLAFDLAVTFDSSPSERSYVNFEDALQLFDEIELLHVKPLMIGSYTQAINYNNRFESGIPKMLGLPPIPNNLAEGIVIRPMRTILVPTKKGAERPIIKSKIPEFSEDRRFHAASKWDEASSSNHSPSAWQSPETISADLSYELSSLVTSQRIDNAISKIGHVEPTDKPRMRTLLDAFISDIVGQVKENFGEQWNSISSESQEALITALRKESIALFREHFNLGAHSTVISKPPQ